jgi:hypothetical protein
MQSFSALIIENREIPGLTQIIENHEKYLPKDCEIYHIKNEPINSIGDYNRLMLSKRLWRNILSERVLIFQHDSGLLRTGIEDFLEWDYCGAPWAWQEHGGNGGLSIRNPKAMMQIIDKGTWNGTLNEDHHICNVMHEFGMNLAPREVCSKFSVEAVFQLQTIGFHAIDVWLTPSECNAIRTQYL